MKNKSRHSHGNYEREITPLGLQIRASEEIGSNMDFFASPSAIVSWAGLSPRNDESAGKIKSRKLLMETNICVKL